MVARNTLFDSSKFVLIVLVIFGHAVLFTGQRWAARLSYDFIYMFHMPAFVFISGFFSKNIDKRKYIKSTVLIIETYIIFQIIYMFLENREINLYTIFAEPEWVMWYLLSLVSWRFLILLIRSFNKKTTLLFLTFSVVGSIVVGFIPASIGHFSLLRTFVFFPFFFLGYVMTQQHIDRFRSSKNIYLLLLYLPVSLILLYFIKTYGVEDLLLGDKIYGFYNINIHIHTILVFKILTFINAVILLMIFFSFIPEKLLLGLNEYGKYTMYIFLFHVILMKAMAFFIYTPYPYLDLFLYTFIPLLCCMLVSKFRYIGYLTNPVSKIYYRLKS